MRLWLTQISLIAFSDNVIVGSVEQWYLERASDFANSITARKKICYAQSPMRQRSCALLQLLLRFAVPSSNMLR